MLRIFGNEMDIIAVYGALLSTALFFWRIYEWRRKSGRLKVHACVCQRTFTQEEREERLMWSIPTEEPPFLVVDMVNKGREAITVFYVGFRREDGTDTTLHMINPPRKLNYGDSYQVFISDLIWFNQDTAGLWVRDSFGKLWWMASWWRRKGAMKNLLRQKSSPKPVSG